MSTSALLFDLGGVIETISPDLVVQEMKKLGFENAEKFFSLFQQSEICTAFELGKVTKEEFISYIRDKVSQTISSNQIVKAWNANLLGVNEESISILNKIRNLGYKMYILSNTNEIHFSSIQQKFYNKYSYELSILFDDVFLSFEIGLRKPDNEIYKYVLNKINLEAEQVLLIDDLKANIESAKNMGIKTHYHRTNDPLNYLEPFVCNISEQACF